MLQSKFDPSDVGGDLDDISEIVVGGSAPIPARPVVSKPAELPRVPTGETYKKLAARKPILNRAIEVLRALMNNEADVQKLLSSVPPEADLQVSVSIGYKVRKAEISRAPMQEALRNCLMAK